MLDNIMMYWLPKAGAASARLYCRSFRQLSAPQPDITITSAVSVLPQEILCASRRWCEQCFKNLVHYNVPDRSGHFAAFEQPALFDNEVRNCFRQARA